MAASEMAARCGVEGWRTVGGSRGGRATKVGTACDRPREREREQLKARAWLSGRVRSELRGALLAVLVLLSLIAGSLTGARPGQAHAADALSGPSRPTQAVAYARVALVRVLSYYIGTSRNTGPVPIQTACSADGVLVGTVGGINSFSYVLVPSAALSPIRPCQGVQAAFSELYGSASGWSLQRVSVLLTAGYTGTGAKQLGSIHFIIDPGTITTDGGPAAPRLLVLPITVPSGAPSHDLPLLTLPQASDAPATSDTSALDLVGKDGQLLGRDSLQPQEITSTLYPLDLSASSLDTTQKGTAPTPKAPDQGATGGTALPGSAPTSATTGTSPLAQQLSLGAPIINSNGRLVGMIVQDSAGGHAVASAAQLKAAIGAISTRPGPLMSAWQQGISAYYSTPPDYSTASTAFATLTSADPDFAGIEPFATAVAQHSQVVAPLLGTPVPTATPALGGTGLARQDVVLILLAGGALLAALLCAGVVVLLARRRRQARALPPEEQGLDLLPREMMYGVPPAEPALVATALDTAEANTQQLRALSAADPVANAATSVMPAVSTARPAPSVSRSILSLVPRVAGMADPGRKRGGEPNQDAILAVTGTRLAGGRTQPFALLAVADGMGGHNNGREASILAINTLARSVMPVLTSQQPLDSATVDTLARDAIQRAHDELRRQNLAAGVDMGTTITVAVVLDDQAYVFNVGDSRTYILNPDAGLRQITTDHSIVASLVAAGVIRPDDIYQHPRRNQIYRSLGGEEETIEADSFQVPLQAGDKLLLCSDGLWEMVRNPQLDHILRAAADPAYAAQLLVREANANGGEDNIGIVVARLVEEVPEMGKPQVRVIAAPDEAQVLGQA